MHTYMTKQLHIAYGSESGTAHRLSYDLKRDLSRFKPSYTTLNELNLAELGDDDLVLIITSTTGAGDVPSNARAFYRQLVQHKDKLNFHFAVFGLGDTNYDDFCGFSIVVDGLLTRKGAKAIAKPVNADVDFEDFFEQWSTKVTALLNNSAGAAEALQALTLQIDPNA